MGRDVGKRFDRVLGERGVIGRISTGDGRESKTSSSAKWVLLRIPERRMRDVRPFRIFKVALVKRKRPGGFTARIEREGSGVGYSLPPDILYD